MRPAYIVRAARLFAAIGPAARAAIRTGAPIGLSDDEIETAQALALARPDMLGDQMRRRALASMTPTELQAVGRVYRPFRQAVRPPLPAVVLKGPQPAPERAVVPDERRDGMGDWSRNVARGVGPTTMRKLADGMDVQERIQALVQAPARRDPRPRGDWVPLPVQPPDRVVIDRETHAAVGVMIQRERARAGARFVSRMILVEPDQVELEVGSRARRRR